MYQAIKQVLVVLLALIVIIFLSATAMVGGDVRIGAIATIAFLLSPFGGSAFFIAMALSVVIFRGRKTA